MVLSKSLLHFEIKLWPFCILFQGYQPENFFLTKPLDSDIIKTKGDGDGKGAELPCVLCWSLRLFTVLADT